MCCCPLFKALLVKRLLEHFVKAVLLFIKILFLSKLANTNLLYVSFCIVMFLSQKKKLFPRCIHSPKKTQHGRKADK